MGVHPDRAVAPPHPFYALTLGEMATEGWELVARCRRCRTALRVDVQALVRLHGADALWWGRTPGCRVVDCPGRVAFLARSHRFGSWRELRALSSGDLERYRRLRRQPQHVQ